jgi:hypothetical protein
MQIVYRRPRQHISGAAFHLVINKRGGAGMVNQRIMPGKQYRHFKSQRFRLI